MNTELISVRSVVLTGLILAATATTVVAGPGIRRRFVRPTQPAKALAKWHHVDVRSGGVNRIASTQPDNTGGAGSLEQILPAHPSAIAEFEVLARDVHPDPTEGIQPWTGGFGLLSHLTELSFDWYRDSASGAWSHITPALRVLVWDPDAGLNGGTYLLIWEGVYNGYSQPGVGVPVDQWVHADITNDNFWRIPIYVDGEWVGPGFCSANLLECYQYGNELGDWGFGPSARVVGLSVAVGGGWNGDYHGFIDNVALDFAGQRKRLWNFEP